MPKKQLRKTKSKKTTNFTQSAHNFLLSYFQRANIHGFAYLGLKHLLLVEKLFWFALVIAAFFVTILLSLKSLNRYEHKNTVVTIERDHYYWNTTLPSFTICPVVKRINEDLFDEYCENNGIVDEAKEEFYEFIESLANATYGTFHLIKEYKSVDKLNIKSEDYMMLIFNLTLDGTRVADEKKVVQAVRNQEQVRCEQILTEQGICYNCNSYLTKNLSAMYWLTGMQPKPLPKKEHHDFYETVSGNLFDNDQTYSMSGFVDEVTIYIHSPFETINIAKSRYYTKNSLDFYCTAVETVADPNFQRDTSISQRHCRFNSESNLTHYPIYTRGFCLQECRMELVYKLCDCIPHFYPNRISRPKPVCSYKVLKECVAPKQDDFVGLRIGKTKKVECECLQNCVDSTVFLNSVEPVVDTNSLLSTNGGTAIVQEYPQLRYKRKVLFSLIDLFVSIGATASLFIGFSVIGIIEIVYFFSLRLFWHVLGKKIEPVDLNKKKVVATTKKVRIFLK